MGRRSEEDFHFKSWASVIVVASVVSAVGLLFDRLLIREGVPRYDLMAISNALTGIVAGAFFWQAKRLEQERRQFIRERLHAISEMNHHIRNAVFPLSLAVQKLGDADSIKVASDAMERINIALKDATADALSGRVNYNHSDVDLAA